MKSLCDRFVAEDEQGIEAEVVAAKDTKTSAATSFDAAAGLAALTKHGIGLVTVRYYNISFGDCGIGFYGRQNCDNCAKMTKFDGGVNHKF